MYEYAARALNVIDGDTLDVLVDLGFNINTKQRVRLLGINCPEHGTSAGDEATAYTKAWIAEHGPDLTIRTVKDRREKYGRLLAQVAAADRILNEDLITGGHAASYDGGRRTLPRQGQHEQEHPVP